MQKLCAKLSKGDPHGISEKGVPEATASIASPNIHHWILHYTEFLKISLAALDFCMNSRCEQIFIFQLLIHMEKSLHIHIQSLSETFRNLISDIHPHPIMTLAKYKTNRQLL